MKKIQLFLLISLSFLMASCQKDNMLQTYDLGSEFLISASGYTSLDNQAVISINNISKNLSAIKITNLGGTLANDSAFVSSYSGSIAIANDGTGSITLSDSNLGVTTIGSSVNFQFDATFNGKPFTRYYTLTVTDPISVTVPAITHRADTTYYFHFVIAPATATVSSVKVQTKVSANGTYVNVPGTFNAQDSIPIKGSDYNIGDTLYVNVIGTAGSKTAHTETAVVIGANSYTNVSSFTLGSKLNSAFDLVGDSAISTPNVSADLELTGSYTTSGILLGFTSPNSTLFVKGASSDYTNADKVLISATDFSSAITANNNVSVGDVYIFKTMRGSKAYYGVMKITDIEKPQGVLADSYITIEYKH